MKATVAVTTTTARPGFPNRRIACPYGCEYSATPGDYFLRRANAAFTCEHDGEVLPCALEEKVYISGTDEKGRPFYGSAWVTLVEEATVADLERGEEDAG